MHGLTSEGESVLDTVFLEGGQVGLEGTRGRGITAMVQETVHHEDTGVDVAFGTGLSLPWLEQEQGLYSEGFEESLGREGGVVLSEEGIDSGPSLGVLVIVHDLPLEVHGLEVVEYLSIHLVLDTLVGHHRGV